jgi:hypothetical protein
MARNPLSGGIERAAEEPKGRDTAALGPSDTTDSGSDIAGIDQLDTSDPSMPVDFALERDIERPLTPPDVLGEASTDSAGTGERRAAGSDPGAPDGSDVSVDRVFDPLTEGDIDDDEDPDLAFVDAAATELDGATEDDDEPLPEDEDDDPVGDGASDASVAN